MALFWLKLNKMCKFFNNYEEGLHEVMKVCVNLQNMEETALFSGKIYTADKTFTRPPVATVATNSKSALYIVLIGCILNV